ncbi:MAG TPA: helix-turn-helix domain-containing protein [Rhizomicrobium sp.]|nr:helix-turn-helix domain-containing protein [Rhizomicrobium sp.]
MALFFDSEWFDARLAASGLKRTDLAAALGLSEHEIAEVWKDQREIAAPQVRVMAALLGVTPQDIARHAGISTPVPRDDADERLARIEGQLQEIKALLAELRERR